MRIERVCKVESCSKKYYAKGYCRNHHAVWWRTGNPLGIRHKCEIKGCSKIVYKGKYCFKHKERIKKGLTTDLRKDLRIERMSGQNNPRWNGGTSQYKNHIQMKKQRIVKLQQTKGLCEICNKRGYEIHHKDETKNNHHLKNLILLCKKCHGLTHVGRQNKTSKFLRLYGMTITKMAEKFGGSVTWYYIKHKQGTLKKFLKQNLTNHKTLVY